MGRIYVVGTADTKGEELSFLAKQVDKAGGRAAIVDVGTRPPTIAVDVPATTVAAHGEPGLLQGIDRGRAVAGMALAFAEFCSRLVDASGMVGIGGGGGTSIVTAGMRRLPIGLPKLMVSTLASGDVSPYVDTSDIMMMPAITDFAGLNRISRVVLGQAAAAIAAMAAALPAPAGDRRPVGLTMFGVTTPAVTQIAERLGTEIEPIVFHATGTGGRTMESLIDSGLIEAAIDVTTTEICDLLFGGVLPALPSRLDCIARRRIPYVGSLGACDMINFWAPDTMPPKYRGRLIYKHNANVTLMRTTAQECRAIGEWIGRKLDACDGPVRFLIPEKGVSALDIEGGVFWHPEADAALFEGLERSARWNGDRRLIRVPFHINDPAFADAAVAAFREI